MNKESGSACALTVRVYYEDTDAGGVVYYANYLRFMERARSEWLRAKLRGPHELALTKQVLFAVRSVTLRFLAPARLDDVLTVTAEPTSIRGASLTFCQTCLRGVDVVCSGEIGLVCVDAQTFAPRRLPEELARILAEPTAL
ncbi:MAG: tol-pal system-associated acyl-CoA thioesterase [Acidiferrobacter sp.]